MQQLAVVEGKGEECSDTDRGHVQTEVGQEGLGSDDSHCQEPLEAGGEEGFFLRAFRGPLAWVEP